MSGLDDKLKETLGIVQDRKKIEELEEEVKNLREGNSESNKKYEFECEDRDEEIKAKKREIVIYAPNTEEKPWSLLNKLNPRELLFDHLGIHEDHLIIRTLNESKELNQKFIIRTFREELEERYGFKQKIKIDRIYNSPQSEKVTFVCSSCSEHLEWDWNEKSELTKSFVFNKRGDRKLRELEIIFDPGLPLLFENNNSKPNTYLLNDSALDKLPVDDKFKIRYSRKNNFGLLVSGYRYRHMAELNSLSLGVLNENNERKKAYELIMKEKDPGISMTLTCEISEEIYDFMK